MSTLAGFRRRTVESAREAMRLYFEPLSMLTKLSVPATGGEFALPFHRFRPLNLLLLIGVISLGAGGWFLFQFMYEPTNVPDRTNLILGGLFFLVALISFGVFFFIRLREEGEHEIRITKF